MYNSKKKPTSCPNEACRAARVKPKQEKVYRFLIMATSTAILLAVLRTASVIVAPMLMALFLTIILIVPLRWLREKGCPNVLSLVIVLGLTGVILVGVGLLVGRSLNDFARQFSPKYKAKITSTLNALDGKLEYYGFAIGKKEEKSKQNDIPEIEQQSAPQVVGAVQLPGSANPKDRSRNIETSDRPEKATSPDASDASETKPQSDSENAVEEEEEDKQEPLGGGETNSNVFSRAIRENNKPSLIELNTESVMYWTGVFVRELRHLAESGFLVIIITLFMTFEAARFPEKVDWALGKKGPINYEHLHHIAGEIRRYLFIKSIACVMSSSAATLVYLCFGVPGSLMWGLVAFFLYFIPNIGGIIASIIPGLLIFMELDLSGVLLYAVCLVAIECSIGYGIEPKMLGHGLGISTVVIFLSLLLWGWILGPVGLFLAAPLTIMVKIILQAFKETEWIAILLGDKNRPEEEET